MIQQVAIIGTGLIGSSLGLGLKKLAAIEHVVGIDKNQHHLQEALDIGAVDEIADLESGVKGADLVVLAVPVGIITRLAERIVPYLDSGTIITDVGSTKRNVVAELEEVLADYKYVGGHPMTGSEVAGPSGAEKHLFENAIYVLTKTDETDKAALDELTGLVTKLGAQVLNLTPEEHDQIVSVTSHLPHVVAVNLMRVITEYSTQSDLITSLIAGGFRDTTRIAAGEPIMWKDIFLNNKDQVLEAIEVFQDNLADFKSLITEEQAEELKSRLAEVKTARDKLPMQKKGLLATNYELILTLPDERNAIGKMATLLGEAGINIQDIEVLKVRDEAGSIRLSFDQKWEHEEAWELLKESGYRVVKR
jgi:prephenate dehydrogenase